MYTLANEWVSIAFDESTGAITRFSNVKTGYAIINQPALAMGLNLLIPVPGHRNNPARSELQHLADFRTGEDGSSAVLRYDSVVTDHGGELPVSAEISVRLSGPQVLFGVTIHNGSSYTVEEVRYPGFGGIACGTSEENLVSRSMQFQGGFSDLFLGDGFANPGYWGTDWPTANKNFPSPNASTPFILLERGSRGLYIGVHRYGSDFAGFIHQYKPGYADNKHRRLLRDGELPNRPAGFCISVSRLPFIPAGASETLSDVVVQFYEGDWHEGIKPYQKWRQTWFHPVKKPGWLDDADCWMTLHINSPEGCCRYPYRELPDIMRQAKQKGVKVLQLIGWARGGQDGDEPYQDTDPLLGTRQELKDAIAEIEAMGIHVLLMCKFKWADQSTPEYKQELYPHTMKDIFGDPVYFGGYSYQTTLQNLSGGSRRVGAGMCHLSEGYRKIALRELNKILDLKPSGILYDELANPLLLCFDQNHGHYPGACIHVGTLKLIEEFYEAGREQLGDDFLLAGEGPSDVLSQYCWGDYIRSGDGNMGEAIHTPVWKYLNPDWHIATCLVGFDDREMVNQCMTYGYAMNYEPYNFKGTPEDVPDTARAVMEAQALRKRLSDYLWNGTFRHTVGVQVDNTGEPCEYIYSLFVNIKNGKRAVVTANQSQNRLLQARVQLEGAEAFDLYRPGTEETQTTNGQVNVEPRSFCVLVEK